MSISGWRPEYSLNIALLDEHHQKLFAGIQQLKDSYGTHEEIPVIYETLKFFMDYAIFHFSEEERLMREHDYPHFEEHLVEHKDFVKAVRKTFVEFQRTEEFPDDFMEYLQQWLVRHILNEDRKYQFTLHQNGIY
ncbi:MAG: hemerythrin family protein [SAR324 cluster bacterium]|nr:hemerythrin family protein [SAR324 cluster bacterium]MBF0352707.1 hemerythrin family protein [SAR324 cluster bacterium]